MPKKKSILVSLLVMMLLPLLIVGVILSFLGWRAVYQATCDETRNTLSVVAHAASDEMNLMYPGELTVEDGRAKKGEEDFLKAHEILDAFYENNKVDITVYFNGKSILSTYKDSEGEMLLNQDAPETIQYYVCEKGMEYYSGKFEADGEKFIVYAIPFGADNAGCILTMQPLSEITNYANTLALKIVSAFIVTILIAAAVCILYANNLVSVLHKMKDYLGSMADRNASVQMNEQVLKRQDEIGEIGRYAITVNEDLSKLINHDPLTNLYNRRAGRAQLKKRIEANAGDITIVLGDIDFFKQVNDTYGHECGDLVLKRITEILQKHMEKRGFAVRWGGEEFLLVFDKSIDISCDKLQLILDEIRAIVFQYEEKEFQVTMTFGVQAYEAGMDMDEAIRLADEKLYSGKKAGRNRIVRE